MRSVSLFAILILSSAASAQQQQRTQVAFKEPAGMKVFWLATGKDGKQSFSTTPLETPGRFNFLQGAAYRLKLTHLPGHPGLELFPTLEVPGVTPHAKEFLAHNAVPITLTEEDISQVAKGSFVTKVVYLPRDGGGDQIALASGQDAVREAARRGSVLLVLRIGNIVEPK